MTDSIYKKLLSDCIAIGEYVCTRNSYCRRLMCPVARFDRFPLIGLRKTSWKTALRVVPVRV